MYIIYVLIVICLVYSVVVQSCYVFTMTVIMYELRILCISVVLVICSVVLDYFHTHRFF
jgi:hypothetical protein